MTGKFIDPAVNIPPTIQQGDSVQWVDVPFYDQDGNTYAAPIYSLMFSLAGATAPLIVTAAALGTGWITTITPAQTAPLQPGTYWWQAQLQLAPNFVATLARGELTVVPNLAVQVAGYSGLSQAEQALGLWQNALAALTGANGTAVKSYKINEREMSYRDITEIQAAISYWQIQVNNEQTTNSISQNQGNPRKMYARFPGRGNPNSPWT